MQSNRKYGLCFKLIHNNLDKGLNRFLAPLGLTTSQMDILFFLSRNLDHAIKQKDIENEFNLENPTVTGLIKRMQAKGLVYAAVNEMDRRSKLICLTQEGKDALAKIEVYLCQTEERFLSVLSEQEQETLYHHLMLLLHSSAKLI